MHLNLVKILRVNIRGKSTKILVDLKCIKKLLWFYILIMVDEKEKLKSYRCHKLSLRHGCSTAHIEKNPLRIVEH